MIPTTLSPLYMIIIFFLQSTLHLTVPILPPYPQRPMIPQITNQRQITSQIYPIPNFSSPFCILGSNPVCGEDNQTYQNPCILVLLKIKKKSDGWCPEKIVTSITTISYKTPNNGYLNPNQPSDPNSPCACNSVYNPVCGKNGVTYASRCRLECSNVAWSHRGPCGYFNWGESPHYNCPCQFVFQPVCAHDGSTYENECTMRCGHQALSYNGACQNPCNCTNTYKPVCGQNNKTYKNQCHMKCDKQELFKNGICPNRKPSHCSYCQGIINPVCATDGITFENPCYMRCSGKTQYSSGVCPGDTGYIKSSNLASLPLCRNCNTVSLPVCGGDNRSYQNACLARCKGIKVQYRGRCVHDTSNRSNAGCKCSKDFQPVCGVDGRTYQNKCFADCFKIKTFYMSSCKVENPSYCHALCRNYTGPVVCGKNRISYKNECIMSGCMRIPLFQRKPCDALNDSNHPGNFSYDLLSARPRAMSNTPPANQVMQRPVNTVVKRPVQVQTQGVIYPKSGSSLNLREINLNDKNSVIKVYKLLFPNGRALNEGVMKYKSILEGLLYNRFKVDPTRLF